MNQGFPELPFGPPEWVFIVLFFVILMAPVGARRIKLPGILGLILAGMLIGPNVLNFVERDGLVQMLGGAGLLFLMFMAGLELDLRASLKKFRKDTILFGGATFVMPMIVGTIALLLWGFEMLAAILIASCWASHTLVSYPIFQRNGVVHNRGVAVAIGATLITNVSALIVLAIVIALYVGGTGATTWLGLGGGMALLVFATMYGLPRLTKWFFAGLGGDRLIQVLYVLTVMFAASALASMVGIEAIVGAFFAGLGLNDHVPKNGVLGERLTFLGDSLLIPVFLISVGMIIDPVSLIAGTTVILLAATFAAQSLGGKLIAAIGVGKYLHYDNNEIGAMFSLTSAEAAATLAAVFVGMEVGLFGQEVIEAVVIVILITCFVSTLLADKYAPRIEAPEPDSDALGRNVIVPVANPETAHKLTEMAARIADADTGTVYPVTVLGLNADRNRVIDNSKLLRDAEKSALQLGVEAKGSVRIDESSVSGVLHQIIEHDGTALIIGWKGYASAKEHLFGGITDTLARRVDIPMLLCRLDGDKPKERIVVHVGHVAGVIEKGTRLALKSGSRLAESFEVPMVIIGEKTSLDYIKEKYKPFVEKAEFIHDSQTTGQSLSNMTKTGDLVIVPAGPRGEISGPEKIAAALHKKDLIIAIGN